MSGTHPVYSGDPQLLRIVMGFSSRCKHEHAFVKVWDKIPGSLQGRNGNDAWNCGGKRKNLIKIMAL
jgi:hypothetical protein